MLCIQTTVPFHSNNHSKIENIFYLIEIYGTECDFLRTFWRDFAILFVMSPVSELLCWLYHSGSASFVITHI